MPKPTPDELDPQVSYKKWSGIKNTVDRERLTAEELEFAVNIDLDDVGQPHRRPGQQIKLSGSWSSLFQRADGVVFGLDNKAGGATLCVIHPDYSTQPLANLGASTFNNYLRLAYTQVGKKVFFTGTPLNQGRNAGGIIDADLSVSPWGFFPAGFTPAGSGFWFSPVVNPSKILPPIRGKILGAPPVGSHLAYWKGRIYIATGPILWLTEPWLYNFVDKTRGFYQFDDDITMVGAVSDGVYVGDKQGVWFLSGNPSTGLKRALVMDTPVIPGTMVYLPGELANPPQVNLGQDTPVKVSIAFMTQEGYCGGMDGGECYNYTEDRVFFPKASAGAATFRRQAGMNHYVVSLNSAGDPSGGARIGDYLEGEIVKAGTWRVVCDRVQVGDAFVTEWS